MAPVSCRCSRQASFVGWLVGPSSDAIGFRLGARCALHRGQMIVDDIDDFFSCGIDFVALRGFGQLHLGLGIEFGIVFSRAAVCPTFSAAVTSRFEACEVVSVNTAGRAWRAACPTGAGD